MAKWRWIPVVVLVLAGMLYASLTSGHPEWERALRWVAERQAAWQSDGCPVLDGNGDAGCSRDDYREASRAAAALSGEQVDELTALADGESLAADALLSATSSAVALLRKGAHRKSDIAAAPRLGQHAEASTIDVIPLMPAFAALRLHARRLAIDHPDEAAGMLLDGLAAATDLASAGIGVERLVGHVAAKGVVDEFADDILRRSDEAALARIAAALETIDAALPVADDFLERELAHRVVYFDEVENVAAAEVHPAGFWAAWRYGFSLRSYAIANTCRQLELLQRSRELADPGTSGWAARQVALRWFEEQLGRIPRDFLTLPESTEVERGSRLASTALGQLRLAVAYHGGKRMPPVVDLLGDGPMRVEVGGRETVFRSAEPGVERTARR